MYKLNDNYVKRLEDSAFIPMDDTNSDYQKYKKWVEEGNIPEPKDPPSKAELNAKIMENLALIDAKKTRAITDALLNKDTTLLESLEEQAKLEREKLIK